MTDVFVYRCLDFDLVESGATPDGAWVNLKNVLKHHIEYCFPFNPVGLTMTSPREEWDRFNEIIRDNPDCEMTESIYIELNSPFLGQEIPISLRRVNFL